MRFPVAMAQDIHGFAQTDDPRRVVGPAAKAGFLR